MIVVDNFLDEVTWGKFNDPSVWEQGNSGNYKFLRIQEKPESILEAVAIRLWNFFDPHHVNNTGSVGYEYWYNILGRENGLGWHFDKDEKHWSETGEIVSPIFGSVLYPYHEVDGGFLEIESGQEIERIAPVPNRAIFFSAGKDRHRVSPIRDGVRKTFACNLWKEVPNEFL